MCVVVVVACCCVHARYKHVSIDTVALIIRNLSEHTREKFARPSVGPNPGRVCTSWVTTESNKPGDGQLLSQTIFNFPNF